MRVIRSASQPDYVVSSDPSLATYVINPDADKDILTKTLYDPKGRVVYSEDALGARTWFGYDGLGRQVKTIANAVGTATDGGVNDPRSASYVLSSAADQDLITITTYDSDGRVQSTQDALNRVSRNVYDNLGRLVRTVQNYVDQGEDPLLWTYNNGWKKINGTTAINHGADNDQNIISSTLYDVKGRVSQTLDHRNNATLTVYDVLDRPIKRVANYAVLSGIDAANAVWDAVDGRWEAGTTAINYGTDKDQNRISTASYDLAGRVSSTRDAAGLETRLTYDALGRRTQTIASYVNGVYSAAAPDEDLISSTVYNKLQQGWTGGFHDRRPRYPDRLYLRQNRAPAT